MSLAQPLTFSQRRLTTRLSLTICVTLFAVVPAAAQHRARLSADLADHLAAGSQTINVIVHGDKATVDALARRYNVTVRKYLSEGGVLRVTAGQLAALRDDADVDHLSGDLRIKSSAAEVTAETIGADQVWSGLGSVPALSGRGVTVAVIDSGIDTRHEALARRVIATRDFTGGDGSDLFGHGTHVAALIAGRAGQTADTSELPRHRVGRVPGEPARARRRRLRRRQRRRRRHGLGGRAPRPIQHRGHQPVARRAGAAVVSRRSDVRGGRARGPQGRGRRRGGGQLREDAGPEVGVRGDCVAGEQPVCVDGGGDRHARDAAAERRHAGDLQLEGADEVRPGDQAGSRGPRQPHRLGGGDRTGTCRRRIPSGTWRAAARTPTSSCRGRAWRPGWSAARWRCCSTSAPS